MRRKYQVFTPYKTVLEMIERVSYNGEIVLNSKVLDLSCGDGAFLCCALQLFLKEAKKNSLSKVAIKSRCNDLFYGYEIDKSVYDLCIFNMNDILYREIGEKIEWKNIKCSDGLKAKIKDFDFVFGNPPYISYQEMEKSTRDYLMTNYESCKGDKFDYSYAFIEKSINCLKDEGKAIIIAPINMYKMKSSKYYRQFISKYIVSIKDSSYENIFKNVITNPAISLFYKNKITSTFFYETGKTKVELSNVELNDRLLFIKNKKRGFRFGDYFKVSCGVATLFNKAFILNHNSSDDSSEKIEEGVLKNAVSPRYDLYKVQKKIIFPYSFRNGTLVKFSEQQFMEKYPNAYNHLHSFKKNLLERDSDSGAKWFEYGRSQAIAFQNQKKLLISAIITNQIHCRVIGPNDIPIAGFFVVPKKPDLFSIEYAISLLADKKVLDYLKSVGIKMSGNSYRYSSRDLEDYIF